MKPANLFMLGAMLAIICTAYASANIPEEIVIGETPYILSYSVTNDSQYSADVTVNYFFPTKTEIIKQPASILANSSENFSVKIYPEENAEGSVYAVPVEILLGGDIFEKEVFVTYKKENKCTVSTQIVSLNDSNIEISAKNNSYKSKTITLALANNIEVLDTKNKAIEIGAFETRSIFAKTQNAQEGKQAELVFDCLGEKISAIKEIPKNADTNAIFAFASLGNAITGQSGIILDIILVLIIGILLIAFIARSVNFFKAGGIQK